ncbi:MAG: ABC transporter permease subunit [Lawsonibacter sp.]|nr:ABC transporter permease subunit [Lawsonibacter sp.]
MRKSAIIWTCVLISIAALYLSLYPGMTRDAENFQKFLGGYPPAVRAMLGINLDYIASILGFYSFAFSSVTLCGAIQGMNLGVSILSKESRERTADFLLVKPVSRVSIITVKILAVLTIFAVTDIIFYAASFTITDTVKTSDFSGKLFLMINLTLIFLQVIFFSLGLVVSVFFKKLKSILPISLGVVFGFYIIGALIATGNNKEAARYLSPFKYFDISYTLQHLAYEAPYMITGAVIVAVAVITTYIIYIKKDIHAVS